MGTLLPSHVTLSLGHSIAGLHINCITTLLHAQRTVANFAACQHHKITILHISRVTALLHYCITAWEGPAVQFTQQMSATFTVSNIHFASL